MYYGILLKFLAKWWKEIFIAVVIAGGMFYVYHLNQTVDSQRDTIARLSVDKKLLADDNSQLRRVIVANSETIAEMSKATTKTKADFEALAAHVSSQTQILTTRLRELKNQPIPVTCDDTINYMIKAAPSYKEQK